MTTANPRPRSITIGFVLFVIGLIFLAVVVLPFFLGDDNRPLWLNLCCLLAPLGFIIALTGAIRAGRADQQAALRQLDQP